MASCKTDFLCTLLPASLVREMVQHVDIECCRQHSMKALVCYLHSILFTHNHKITVWVEILALGMNTLGETGCSRPFSPIHMGFSNPRAFELPSS